MGRQNGTWSPVYGQVWTHPKTMRAAAHARAATRGIREEVAPFLVVGWLNRVCLWCLANGETGQTGVLSDARLASIAWPEALEAATPAARVGAVIRGALRAGGFLVGEGDEERVHDFLDHHARIVKERRRKRIEHDRRDGIPAPRGAEQSAETSAPPSAEASAATDTDTDTDTATDKSPPDPPGGGGARGCAELDEEARIAADLAQRLGSTPGSCRKQVAALAGSGWPLERVRAAVLAHATAGRAPWEWTKLALAAAAAPPTDRNVRCLHCAQPATAGPGVPGQPLPLGLEADLCPGHLTAWFEAREAAEQGARARGPLQTPSGPDSPVSRAPRGAESP